MDILKRIKDFHVKYAAFHAEAARDNQDECDQANHDCEGSCFYAKRAAGHAAMGEFHSDCAKAVDAEFGKAFASRGSELEPLPQGLSTITPDVPSHIRAIPRTGQREIAEPQIDARFAHIVKVD